MLHKNRSVFILLVLTVVIMNMFMISLLAYTLDTSRERQEAQVKASVENLTLLLEKSVSLSSKEIDLSLHALQTYIEKELGDKKQINDKDINILIQKQENWISIVARIHITDVNGRVKFGDSAIGGEASNYASYSFFKEAQQKNTDQLFVTKLIRDPNGQGWVNLLARRYNQPDGAFAGMIVAALPASYFNHLIAELDVGPKGVVVVQDLDMRVIARNPMLKTPNGQVGFVGGPPELSQLVRSGAHGTIYTRQTTDHIPRIGHVHKISSMPVFVVVAFAEEDYLAQWYEDVIKAVLLGLLFIAVTTIAGWLLWQQIRANMFTNRRSRMLLRNAQDGIHVLDREGKLLQGSDSFFRMIGSTPQAALGKTLCYWDNGYNKAELQELINRGISTPGAFVSKPVIEMLKVSVIR